MLMECAGSVIGPLASVVGGEKFLPWLRSLIPPLLGKLVSSSSELLSLTMHLIQELLIMHDLKPFPRTFYSIAQTPKATVADKSFAVGTLAEVGLFGSSVVLVIQKALLVRLLGSYVYETYHMICSIIF